MGRRRDFNLPPTDPETDNTLTTQPPRLTTQAQQVQQGLCRRAVGRWPRDVCL